MEVTGEGRPKNEDGEDDVQNRFRGEINPEVGGGTEDVGACDPYFGVDDETVGQAKEEDEAGVGEADDGGEVSPSKDAQGEG